MVIQDAGLVFKGNLTKRRVTEYIFLHHAANNSAPVEAVHNYHLKLGWSGIGYHFYVRKDGEVWRGRPIDTTGAHATNYNYNSVSVCAEGNFEIEEMDAAQRKSITELLAYLWGLYPSAAAKRHRDVAATACPGRFYPYAEIVSGAKNIKASPEPEAPATPQAPATAPTDGAFIALPTLKRGAYGESVKAMQILLIGRNFSCGRWGPDGSFGGATDNALRSFQRAAGLTVDGVCGLNTWRKLLGA